MQSFKPRPLFNTLATLQELYKECQANGYKNTLGTWLQTCLEAQATAVPTFAVTDHWLALGFLYSYRGSEDTFNAYRRELERLLQRSWFVQKSSILDLKRPDLETFIEFCKAPYKRWIGTKTVARFTQKNGQLKPNPDWRPFSVKVSKKAFQDGKRPIKVDFALSQPGMRALFAVLGSFYNYLVQEEFSEINPILQIRQKSKFMRKTAGQDQVRRLSDLQWQTVINIAATMAQSNKKYHRTLFIMQILYSMYLRISELVALPRWTPTMSDFYSDHNGAWWFKTVGKGNKERRIAVSDAMLQALKQWRAYLELSPLPTADDKTPLIPKQHGKGPVTSTRAIRNIVQQCFDKAVTELQEREQDDEAQMLRSATVHWLRHTGISDDVKHRPREHVRDDAGHSSGSITDRYIDVELAERAKSAKNNPITDMVEQYYE